MLATDAASGLARLAGDYRRIRQATVSLCEPLTVEDHGVQPMADASPPKWHLAHTSWFFETFLLVPYLPGYRVFHPAYEVLFNSYYNGVGHQYPRSRRGMLARPGLDEVHAYRAHVDAAMRRLLDSAPADPAELARRCVLGLHHEQQHQELLLTDLKVALGSHPLLPAYRDDLEPDRDPGAAAPAAPLTWVTHPGGILALGVDAPDGLAFERFVYDNETPRHRQVVAPFELASRLVTNAEFHAFMEDGGYRRPELWLSDGWTWLQQGGARPVAGGWPEGPRDPAPMYWLQRDGSWREYRLGGAAALEGAAPVTHVSAWEADAYARWAGARLPTEHEWEVAALAASGDDGPRGQLRHGDLLHPSPAPPGEQVSQLFGDAWEWTCSAYAPYPGFRPFEGALGEYNGKFMANQLVLRGGSCATPADHIRATYRNFFYPPDRWQFTAIRLAR